MIASIHAHLAQKEQWREGRLKQQEKFQDVLHDNSALTSGFTNSEQLAGESFQLQYELRTCQVDGDTDMCTQVESIVNRVVAIVQMAPPIVPEWFASSDDVELHIALSSLKPRDFEVRAAQWFSVRHPNVVSLYGAYYVANAPFFVCEYDPKGINLEHFVQDDTNHCLIWEKLYEAALGLNHLHQRQVAHGNLRREIILISRDGSF
ncbi:Serine/threonine protein kinase, partial [Globisporangium splendens]